MQHSITLLKIKKLYLLVQNRLEWGLACHQRQPGDGGGAEAQQDGGGNDGADWWGEVQHSGAGWWEEDTLYDGDSWWREDRHSEKGGREGKDDDHSGGVIFEEEKNWTLVMVWKNV